MLWVLLLGFIALVGAEVWVVHVLTSLTQTVRQNSAELKRLRRRVANTRVAQASVRHGEPGEGQMAERQSRKLGRVSAARRQVVGGDDDSEQKLLLLKSARRGQLDRDEEGA